MTPGVTLRGWLAGKSRPLMLARGWDFLTRGWDFPARDWQTGVPSGATRSIHPSPKCMLITSVLRRWVSEVRVKNRVLVIGATKEEKNPIFPDSLE